MLTEIIWAAVGLVKGALGNVYDISQGSNVTGPAKQTLSVLLIRFDRYTGPAYFDDSGLAAVALIYRSTRDFLL
jgi:hypothetical protein